MIRLGGADHDIGDVLDVDGSAVARGQQQQADVGHALQGLADDDGQRAAVLAQRAGEVRVLPQAYCCESHDEGHQ